MSTYLKERIELKRLTDILLNDETTWIELRQCLHSMDDLFKQLNKFDVYNENVSKQHKFLDTGSAISPWAAAMCLFDIVRTKLFVKGIIQAIKSFIKSSSKRPIQVLDAGCGPNALLSILTAQYFTEEDVQFHLIDIHEKNLTAAKMLINNLALNANFGDFTLADA
jgi:hypothetical protein